MFHPILGKRLPNMEYNPADFHGSFLGPAQQATDHRGGVVVERDESVCTAR